jgi:hypothetical protein
MKKNKTKEEEVVEETQAEHMMETFPEPRGMPAEWHQHEVKIKASTQVSKEEPKIAETSEKTDAEKEEHQIEKFPKPRTMPKEWHCTHCEDEES